MIQSLDEQVLLAAGRGHSVLDVVNASKLIKKYGITLGHQLMPGLPKSTPEKDIKSAIDSIKMEPDIVRIYPSLVIKDTPMEIMYKKGDYSPYTLDMAVEVSKKTINEGGDIIAGPFHPAFRELVESSLILDKIKENVVGKNFDLLVNNKDVSKLYANKKVYFNTLKEDGYSANVKITDEVKRGTIIIKDETEKKITI